MSPRFAQFSDDVIIQAIGPLFRKLNDSRWSVNLGLSPWQKKHALLISNAPVLARKRILNQDNKNSSLGYRRSFTCAGTHTWDSATISNFPSSKLLPQISCEQNQWCFTFIIDDGITIFLPHFELARSLFLHNGYLSRTAMESDCLAMEFDISLDSVKSVANINVLPTSSYPLHLYSNPDARRVLSWVLIDPDARASYESIGRCQKLHGTESNGYRHWDFQFAPPPLGDVHFDVKGVFDKATKSLFVYEVLALRNINANVPETVLIHHPRFRGYEQGDGPERKVHSTGGYPEFAVYDDLDANADNEHYLLSGSKLVFEFSQPFETAIAGGQKQTSSAGREDGKDSDAVSLGVSTDEPTTSGGLPCADWDIVVDETDDVDIYISKFECFYKMLDYLGAEFDCEISSRELRKLPALPRVKKHLLATDGTPRHMAIVKLKLKKCVFYLLEIDTSDSISPLSTQLLCLGSSFDLQEKQLEKLAKGLVRNSIHWPTGVLYDLCGPTGGYKRVSHPKTGASNKALLEPDSVAHWAARIHARMQEML